MSKANLRLDWCSHEAAKYAVEHWHYSKCMPVGKTVKIGVWERGVFIGCIIYSRGASPPLFVWTERALGASNIEACELTRVALNTHEAPVSRMLAISLRMLKQSCPKMRVVVSFADVDENHRGGIYQATNWVYCGLNNVGQCQGFIIHGRKRHRRSIGALGYEQSLKGAQQLDPDAVEVKTMGKHKYLYALDTAMKKQIELLRKPYPKRPTGGADSS